MPRIVQLTVPDDDQLETALEPSAKLEMVPHPDCTPTFPSMYLGTHVRCGGPIVLRPGSRNYNAVMCHWCRLCIKVSPGLETMSHLEKLLPAPAGSLILGG